MGGAGAAAGASGLGAGGGSAEDSLGLRLTCKSLLESQQRVVLSAVMSSRAPPSTARTHLVLDPLSLCASLFFIGLLKKPRASGSYCAVKYLRFRSSRREKPHKV